MRLGLCLSLLLVTPPHDANEEAERMLAKAEKRASQGKFDEAHALYRRLAKRFPDTEAGIVGERRGRPSAYLGCGDVVRHGRSDNRVDIVLMGEGYQIDEMAAFAELAEDVPDVLERNEVFGEYFRYFNFLRADLVSADNGVDGFGRDYDTALGGKTLGTFAGHVGIDREAVRRMLDEMPAHDGQAIVFAKLGVLGTGGGGVATIGGRNMATMIHELGHSFAGLSDEYTAQQAGRSKDAKPRRNTNIATSADPEESPWKHWLEAEARGIGMYQGGAQFVRGAWRPTASHCLMGAGNEFCPVCREEIVLRIYSYCDPIDAAEPAPIDHDAETSLPLTRTGIEFEVTVLEPESHDLEVEWWVVPESEAPRPIELKMPERGGRTSRAPSRTTTGPGGRIAAPLIGLRGKPASETRPGRGGVHEFRLRRSAVEPGRYRVLCRVRDTTEVKGSKLPWVLKDDGGMLSSEVGWWVELE